MHFILSIENNEEGRTMKKLLLFLLVLTLLLGACTPSRESEEKTESEIQAEIENEEKPTELTVYGVGTGIRHKI